MIPKMSAKIQFDPFLATASDLQTRLADGHVTSTQLVQDYLAQIARNNEYLRAVIVTSRMHSSKLVHWTASAQQAFFEALSTASLS